MRLPIVPRRILAVAMVTATVTLGACATPATRHALTRSELGTPSRMSSLEASLNRHGTVAFRRIAFAEWTGGRGSFIDRKDPRTASVPEGTEQAVIYAYVVDHPRFGRVMVDTGISTDLEPRLGWIMRRGVKDLSVRIDRTTAGWLEGEIPPRAVFLTHLHFDHIGGLIDLDPATPVHVGPGDATERSFINWVLGHPADSILQGYGPLREWQFRADPDGAFAGVIDVFGDGSVWALHVPGHSPGSTAYLINAVDGPKLVVGDAVHTRLGWDQAMPQPVAGEAGADAEASADRLRRFAAAHPQVEVFLGHQSRSRQAARAD